MSTPIVTKPAVLSNRPAVDSAGNRLQEIVLLFACGHQERSYRLNLSGIQKGWKPPTNAQLMREELTISCPRGYKLCRACTDDAAHAPAWVEVDQETAYGITTRMQRSIRVF